MIGRKLFLQLSEAQSTGLRRRRPLMESAAGWCCGQLIKNLIAHYNSQFCVSFPFNWNPQAPIIVPKHNYVLFQKSIAWTFNS